VTIVEDMNVVTFHMLECIAHYIQAKKEPIKTVSGSGSLAAGGTSLPADSVYGEQTSGVGDSDLDPAQNMVLSSIHAVKTDEGASVQQVIGALTGSLSEPKIREIIDWLSEEGHIYSTIDEDHYRTVQE